jgi:hypothetical protein
MTLMTAAQHREQAALQRSSGEHGLANQHSMLANAIEKRARFILSPAQHRARAVQLRANRSPEAQELAVHHENLAQIIERRDAEEAGV